MAKGEFIPLLRRRIANTFAVKEFTINTGFLGVTLGGSTKLVELRELLSEVYHLKNILSEACYKFRVLEIHLTSDGVEEDDENELEFMIAKEAYLPALHICMQFSQTLYTSKYFALLPEKNREKLEEFLNYTKFEKLLYEVDEESEDLANPEEKIAIMTGVLKIYDELEKEIKRLSDKIEPKL